MPRASVPILLAASLLAPTLAAQSNNVELLAQVKEYNRYNDIWGYTAPNGDEYAIVGTTTGTAFYNCVDPRNPYRVGFIAGPNSIWRDMKTWDHYAYIVTEGGGGVQIVDLDDPESPTLVKTWGTQYWGNAHNIAVDTGTGYAYVCGTNSGMRVLNLNNPENPSVVATYNSDYVHDLHVQNGQGHLSEVYDGRYRIVNVNNLPSFPTKDSVQTPGRFCHNAWANETDTLCVTTDEVSGGSLGIYDISSPNDIQHLATWTIHANSIVHNVYIRDDWAYASWYTQGLVVVDLSNPASPSLVGSYDTSSYGAGSGFHGAWGCYPFAPSGVVYISDIEEGLHILEVQEKAMDLTHASPLPNTQSESGPYTATVVVDPLLGTNAVTGVDLLYRVQGGSWQTVGMNPGAATNEWTGEIPGHASPEILEYYFFATDDEGNEEWLPDASYAGDDSFAFIVGELVQEYFNDFEGPGDQGWVHGADWGFDDWERGVPHGKSGTTFRHEGTTWYDPDTAVSGTRVWGTDLGAGTNDGAYSGSSQSWLESPAIDCSAATNSRLVFQRWASIEGSPNDYARILVNGQVVWENPPVAFTGSLNILDAGWKQEVIDISAIADNNPSVVVRFLLDADADMSLGGWQIDDFEIVSIRPSGNQNTIVLTGPAIAPVNQSATFTVSNAPANETFTMLYSPNQGGLSYQGHTFDVGVPVTVAGTGAIDALGNGTFTTVPLPPGASGLTFYIEVGVDTGSAIFDSNVHVMTIQ